MCSFAFELYDGEAESEPESVLYALNATMPAPLLNWVIHCNVPLPFQQDSPIVGQCQLQPEGFNNPVCLTDSITGKIILQCDSDVIGLVKGYSEGGKFVILKKGTCNLYREQLNFRFYNELPGINVQLVVLIEYYFMRA